MKVLVIGQGGREHALVSKLAESKSVSQVFCAPGNAGTQIDATNVAIDVSDIPRMLAFAKEESIQLAIVGPEVPLVAGMADALREAGVAVFGPSKAAAELEGSKSFAKQMMWKANVPTAKSETFSNFEAAEGFLEEREEQPLVIKADGLAAGKGVLICDTKQEARDAIQSLMRTKEFGDAGETVIIEEKLIGQEVSILAIVSGDTIIPLETSQDHKAAYDGDLGPNTGGMGAYSPAPLVTEELMDEIIEKILVPMVNVMKTEERPFNGVLYAGLMITNQGPKVLEFNVRFGDPEAQPVLMRLKTDLAQLLLAAAEERLGSIEPLEWDERPAICVVMASEGYPGDYEKGKVIRGLNEAAKLEDTKVFHAGTTIRDDEIVTDGGRVLGVTAIGETIGQAKLKAYQAVKCIRWDGAWCRKDISDKAR
ncbi:MAG: phosphoribosylamine--glycine ligase [Planctomycetes bacterium]|nr:phosphoribosylamine--glycine ligase [Planctomycetota bacterium]MCH9726506.1 phosphoribosylamine--glycine ligase [Planctomycetota bacterium]MCH9778315.1 phosphoribosylamine--glycine ligase [Planctomycetota bacterium]MCH9790264.1 phosphoribosylamine--glycine ligase [Planctomycetota bacterium]